ncbi:hypothetical protein MKX03_012678 [Papaver bracteatum]|nr:hypothetical protein MKX03_012678 [Papaver bracteatum]
MEGSSSEQYHQWMLRENHDFAEEKKLELTLGPPGDDQVHHHQVHNYINSSGTHNYSNQNLSFPWCSSSSSTTPSPSTFYQQQEYLNFAGAAPQQNLCTGSSEKVVELQNSNNTDNNKACFAATPAAANKNISQKRTSTAAAVPVVGWPPIRSYRKNLANSATKPVSELEKGKMPKENSLKAPENCRRKGLFVKINMDGVPIGRKVDIKAYDSYEKLSYAVDELFRCLLAAQRDTSSCGIHNKKAEVKAITGLLDGGGEYTLVYEDNEGDRMLVGDVPWEMFASTVKRLRVLKSSELSALRLCSSKQDNKNTQLCS